jgi:hypothetical protein
MTVVPALKRWAIVTAGPASAIPAPEDRIERQKIIEEWKGDLKIAQRFSAGNSAA